jgi:shikimate dehydrogenase
VTGQGAAKTFILIGHPVSHSLSPAIHHAAYAELGLTGYRYVAVDCSDEGAVRAELDALRRGDTAGANVTVPWKRLALELADDVHASARATGAANVLAPAGEGRLRRVIAHNTDVPALAEELRSGRPGARSATLLGNGGAALAAVAACRALGIEGPVVTARGWRGGRSRAWRGADEFASGGAVPVAWPDDARQGSEFHRAVESCDVIVQSTSDGMRGATDGTSVRDIIPWAALDPNTFAYDVVYNPAETAFVRAARARGLTAENGLGMLVRQAALAIELWLGGKPPLEPLAAAAARALAEKERT